jgi:Plasma-membrane choline transporter
MAVVAILYTCSVWSRIPFAAANLVTAVTAVRANIGLTFYAFLSIFLLLVWSVLWLVSASSTIFVLGNCDADGVCSNEVSGIAIFLFLVSFHWTIQVITNVVYVSCQTKFRDTLIARHLITYIFVIVLQTRHHCWHCRHLLVCSRRSQWMLLQCRTKFVCSQFNDFLW